MAKQLYLFLLSILFISISGCAHVISKDLRVQSDPSLFLSKVRENPEAFKGKLVVWGGEIIETVNQENGSTQIEVYQRPLGWRGEPREIYPSEGRFLVLDEKFIDAYIFQKGKKITVAGEIQGAKIKPLGEMDYRYPLLASKQIYLWPEYYYRDYPYDPWWGYPFWGWGFGSRYYYFPHHPHHHPPPPHHPPHRP